MVLAGKKPLRKRVNKRFRSLGGRKKMCRLCADKLKVVDYKDVRKLESFISDRSKIISSRISGNCAKHQRRVTEAIKRARFLSLIPYTR